MEPGRLVSLCFLYSGGVLLATHSLTYGLQLALESVARYAVALVISGPGLYRLSGPARESPDPDGYGPITYGMGVLAFLATVLFLAQLLVF